jgi:hypothetical protein
MPTPSNDLDAAVVAYEKARDELSKAQEAASASRSAVNVRALEQAQEKYKTAGQAARRAKDPDRAHEVLEFQRYLAEKARIRAQRAKRGVMGA